MAPEYGATMGFFPVDQETLNYLRFTNRDPHQVALVEAYTKEQGLFHSAASPEPLYIGRWWNSIWRLSRRPWPDPSGRRTASSCPP